MKLICTLFAGLLLAATTMAQQWLPIGPNDDNRPGDVGGRWLDAARSGTTGDLYICYNDRSNAANGLVVKRWNGSNWTTVGNAIATPSDNVYNSIAVAADGTVYVATTPNTGSNTVSVFRLHGGIWQAVGNAAVLSADFAKKVQLAISPAGTLYMGFLNFNTTTNQFEPVACTWDGSNWNTLGNLAANLPANAAADDLELEVSPQGTVFVSYLIKDFSVAANNVAAMYKWSGSTWTAVGSNAIFETYRSVHSMAIDANDVPHVVGYSESSGIVITAKKLNPGTGLWEQLGNTSVSGTVYGPYDYEYASLQLDAAGVPYIALKEPLNFQNSRVTVMRLSGGTWEAVGSRRFSLGAPDYLCLAFNSSNQPVVLYTDRACGSADPNTVVSDLVQVQQFNGTNWQLLGNNGFSTYGAGYFHYSIDKNNNMYAASVPAYSELGNRPYVKRWNGSTWADVGTQPVLDEPVYYSISTATDDAGNLYLAYRNHSVGGYAVRKYTVGTNTWSTVGNNITSAYYIYRTALMIDRNNQPVVTAQNVSGTPAVFRFDGSTWQTLTGSGVTGVPTLLRGKNGVILLCYANNTSTFIKRYNESAGTWDLLGNPLGVFGGFAVDTTGVTDTVYMGRTISSPPNTSIQVIKVHNGTVDNVGNLFSAPTVGFNTEVDIAIGSNSTPYMAYRPGLFKIGTAKLDKAANTWQPIGSALANGLGQADDVQLKTDVAGDVYGMYNSGFMYLKKIQTGSVLPIRGLQATAAKTAAGILLRWQWQDDADTRRFAVQYSTDGRSFATLTHVLPPANGSKQQQYLLAAPAAEALLYRIVAEDGNGRLTYSNIVGVQASRSLGVTIQQNAGVRNQLYVTISSSKAQPLTYRLVDATGQVYGTGRLTTSSGVMQHTLPVVTLPAGLYQLQVFTAQGTAVVQRLVIQ